MKHIDDLKDSSININNNKKCDAIALSETWLMPNNHDLSDFVLDWYTLHTSSRNSYVNDEFSQKVICNISKVIEDCMKTMFLEIVVKYRKVQISCLYRAPNTDICIFNEELHVICQ